MAKIKPRMKWLLEKHFTFDAAHQLAHMPEGHKCGGLHGHTWTVIVRLASYSLDMPQQWVMDFGDVKKLVNEVLDNYDHGYLNQVVADNPTCEILSMVLFREIAALIKPSKVRFLDSVTVFETEGNGCTFRLDAN